MTFNLPCAIVSNDKWTCLEKINGISILNIIGNILIKKKFPTFWNNRAEVEHASYFKNVG